MAAPPIPVQGTTVTISTSNTGGSPITINGIEGLTNVDSGKAQENDVTTFASTAHEFRIGLPDFGSFTMAVIFNLDDAGQNEIENAREDQILRTVVITLPNTNPVVTKNIWTATALVTSFKQDMAKNNEVRGEVTFRISGKPTWT